MPKTKIFKKGLLYLIIFVQIGFFNLEKLLI